MTQDKQTPGRISWRELMTTDPAKAKAFYAGLFGWTTRDVPFGAGGQYTLIDCGQKQIGGLLQSMPGMPSGWSSYVSVTDVDAAAVAAREHGAKIIVEPTDIPNVGRFSIFADFGGAVIVAFKTAQSDPEPARPGPGEFCWETLSTNNIERAKAFYGATFGWKAGTGANGIATFGVDATPQGQVADVQLAESSPPHWMTYVVTIELEKSLARVRELGGEVIAPLIEIPTIGRIGVISDPTGGVLGLFQSA